MSRPYVARVEGDDPDALAEDLAVLASKGYRVECHALDERMRLAKRDEYLRRAGGLMSAGSTWGKSVALAKEIDKFQTIVWPRWRNSPSPPEGCSELRRYLFEARRLGELPSSERWLYDIILKPDGVGAFSGECD